MNKRSLLVPTKAPPTPEEVAARPELLKTVLSTVSDKVDELDLEHAVIVTFSTKGSPTVFHTYGHDLSMQDAAKLFTDIATMARKQARKANP